MKNKRAFIAGKPIQFLNCANISEKSYENVCVGFSDFCNNQDFINRIRESPSNFLEFLYFSTKTKALLYVILHQRSFSHLYIDSDYGLSVRFLLLFICRVKISVFEEGFANYSYLRTPKKGLKNKIFDFITSCFHIENYNGGSCKVSKIYIYDHLLFKKNIQLHSYHKLTYPPQPFLSFIGNSELCTSLYKATSYDFLAGFRVLIFASNWEMPENVQSIIDPYKGWYKILKPHPHIANPVTIDSFDYLISGEVILEYSLLKLLDIAEHVHVIHYGTFALHYFDKRNPRLSETILKS